MKNFEEKHTINDRRWFAYNDRRQFTYTAHVPERRSGADRRELVEKKLKVRVA